MKPIIISSILLLFATSSSYGQTVQDIIDQVSKNGVIQMVRDFSGEDSTIVNGNKVLIRNRVSNSVLGNDLAADYLKEQLTSFGLAVTDNLYSAKGRNVYASQIGSVNPDNIYVICGHYDAVADYCADDNTSATSTILEAARILSNYEIENTIIYAFWDEEETGLMGARNFANAAAANGDNILAVLNIDMMAYDSNNDKVFDIDVRDIANSYEIRDDLIALVDTHNLDLIPLVVDPGTPLSDHKPFWDNGFSAVLFGESWETNDQNSAYHTANDRINLFNIDYYFEMVKLAVAYITTKAVLIPISDVELPIESRFDVFPNPTNGFLNIDFNSNFEGKLELFSFNGQLLLERNIKGSTVQINLKKLAPANYLVRLSNAKGETASYKIWKE